MKNNDKEVKFYFDTGEGYDPVEITSCEVEFNTEANEEFEERIEKPLKYKGGMVFEWVGDPSCIEDMFEMEVKAAMDFALASFGDPLENCISLVQYSDEFLDSVGFTVNREE